MSTAAEWYVKYVEEKGHPPSTENQLQEFVKHRNGTMSFKEAKDCMQNPPAVNATPAMKTEEVKAPEAAPDPATLMEIGNNVSMLKTHYLAGFKEDRIATYPTVPMLDIRAEHTHDGAIADLHQKFPELEPCLFNDVKMCECGKPCAYTLVECNACGKKLPDAITKSENVFAAFLFGVKSAARGFPYKISLRQETENVLIFDDMLQLCPLHFNAIPKKYYIPDCRYLFPCPKESLELLNVIETELVNTTRKFLADPAFRKAMYKTSATDDDIVNNVIASFNFPPSQFQMHVQWMVPPLMPFHHMMAISKNHYHEGRAFPLSYVKKCLALDKPYEVTKNTPIEAIIDHFNGLGVNYKTEWTEWYEKICLAGGEALQNWNHDDFEYVVSEGKVHNFTVEGKRIKLAHPAEGIEASEVQKKDMDRLRNYGRPYSSDGKPAGTYIQNPLKPKFGEGGFLAWPPSVCAASSPPDPSALMTIANDVKMLKTQYLAGFKEDRISSYPTIPMLDVRAEATFDGAIADLHKQYPEMEQCMFNEIKMCECGKPCAYTLQYCNSCGKALPETITQSENVFAAFLFGVKKAARGFPYKISLRRETEDVLIFDDMLCLTPLHFNGISKKYYMPDWRYLLPHPKQSLELLNTLETELWEATKMFLGDPAFRKTMYKSNVTDEDIRNNIICSFNFPPSQFQMHVQWMCPPLMPFHHMMAITKNHYHEGRAFPLSYVKKCLELNQPYEVDKNTPIEGIMEHFRGLGVDYTSEWTDWYEKICLAGGEALQNWNHDDFQYVVDDGKVYDFTVEDGLIKLGAVQDVKASEVQTKDNDRLRNYGRPYTGEGKPDGTYIQKPLQPKWGEGGFLAWPPA